MHGEIGGDPALHSLPDRQLRKEQITMRDEIMAFTAG